MTRELLSFFEDTSLLRAFEVVAEERKIRFGELREILNLGREEVIGKLDRLEEAGLVKSRNAPGHIEDLNWYFVTAKGLAAEREVHRLELVP